MSRNYSGPEGARVKVSPPFILIICRVLNFLNGYKAYTRILSLGTKVKILLHHCRRSSGVDQGPVARR